MLGPTPDKSDMYAPGVSTAKSVVSGRFAAMAVTVMVGARNRCAHNIGHPWLSGTRGYTDCPIRTAIRADTYGSGRTDDRAQRRSISQHSTAPPATGAFLSVPLRASFQT